MNRLSISSDGTAAPTRAPSARLAGEAPGRAASLRIGAFLLVNHAGALAAFWCFTPLRCAVAVSVYLLAGLGVTLGYHRLLAHRSFKTYRWLEYVLAVLGSLALQGGPVRWVATHRQHHRYADGPNDPHDVGQGFWHAHIGWFLYGGPGQTPVDASRHARDLLRSRFHCRLQQLALLPSGVLIVALFLAGGLPLVLWAFCLRTTVGHHASWCVNSVCHRYGRRPHPRHAGRNNGWVALLTLGEGWHNNHHACPSLARHGTGRWQLDASARVLSILAGLRLVWGVVRQPARATPSLDELP